MRKITRFFFILFFLVLPISASAAEPELTWERAQLHQVDLDPALFEQITAIELMGQGETLQFALNQERTSEGNYIYRILIPASFSLGSYSVRATLVDGTFKTLATIKVVEYQSQDYAPLQDPKTITTLSVTFFALLTTIALSDMSSRKRDDDFEGDQTTFEGADGGALGRSAGDRRAFRKGLFSSIYLDQLRSVATISSNRISPLISRLIADSSYLQYSLGSLVLIFPLIGVLLGGLAFQDIQGVGGITTPSLSIVLSIVILGVIDSASGFVAALTFGFVALTSSRFQNVYDIRLYLGLSLLFFTPTFIANGLRALRKSRKDSDYWERLIDIVIGSCLTGWAIKCLVQGLDGFAHLRLPLGNHANTIGICSGVALAIRYIVEGYVNQHNHYYLAYVSPKLLHEQNSNYRIVGWFIRGILFLFFAVSFLGVTWQLWLALFIFMAPNVIKLVKDKFPNFPTLFQLIPIGIPGMVFMTLFGKAYSKYLDSLALDPVSEARTSFILAAIPGLILTFLKFFGREPATGDVRWYRRDQNRVLYQVGGVFLFAAYALMTLGIIG